MKVVLYFCIISSLVGPPSFAQDPDKAPIFRLWGNAGLGMVGPGLGGHLGVAVAYGPSSLSFKSESGTSVVLFGPNEMISGGSILYGWIITQKSLLYRIAAGPGYYKHSFDTTSIFAPFRSSSTSGFGGSLEAEFMYTWKYVGIGVTAGILATKDHIFPKFTINLNLGKLQ